MIYYIHPFAFGLSDAAIAYAIDLANGEFDEEREIVDAEYEEVNSTHGRPSSCPDN